MTGSINSIFGTKESRLMKVVDPSTGDVLKTGEGENTKEMGILFQSKDSSECKAIQTRFQRKWGGKKKMPSATELDRHTISMQVAAATGFENIVDDNGPIEFSKDAARKLLESSPALVEQVEEFLTPESFLAKGSSSD